MTLSQNIRHRRAAAAAAGHIRRDPQIGFSPTAVFNRPTPPFPFPTFGRECLNNLYLIDFLDAHVGNLKHADASISQLSLRAVTLEGQMAGREGV